ncbi:DNA-directed RNA polymerase subunit epsilon, partial [Natrinema soli]
MQDDGADPGPDSERAAAVADGVESDSERERHLETRPGSGSLSRA